MSNEELIRAIKNGKNVQDNMYLLYIQNLPLLKRWSKTYNKTLEIEDIMQECYIAIHNAVQGFCLDNECKFTTYLKKAVKWHFSYTARVSSNTKLSIEDKQLLTQYNKLNIQEQKDTGNDISLSKACHLLHCTEKDIQRIMQYLNIANCSSIDKPIDDDMNILEVIPADTDIEKEYEEQENINSLEIWQCVDDVCTDREQNIIKKHYKNGNTLKQIAADYDVSLARVQQIEKSGFKRLKQSLNFIELARQNDYIDISYRYGYSSFKHNCASSVEYVADMRDRMQL